MFKLKNGPQFSAQLTSAVAALRKECTQFFRGFVTAVFHNIVLETPQWSGNAASNWNVSLGAPDLSVTYALKEVNRDTTWTPMAQKGDLRGVMLSVRRAADNISRITLGSSVYVANDAKNLRQEGYMHFLENNPNGFLREVNNPGHMLEYSVAKANSIGIVSPATFSALMFLKPGGFHGGVGF